MKSQSIALLTIVTLATALVTSNAWAGAPVGTNLPGPGIFALIALGVVGAIGISRLRK